MNKSLVCALRRLSPLLALPLLAAPVLANGIGDNALLVVDPANPESMYVANYYKAARGIPDVNFLYIDPDATNYPEFAAVNVPALTGRLANARIRDRIDFVVLPPGGNFYIHAPGLITDPCYTPQRISISSGYTLALIADQILGGMGAASRNHFSSVNEDEIYFDSNIRWQQGNPSDAPGAKQYFIGAMLGYTGNLGNTLAEVLAMIDRGVAVDGTFPTGTFYFMETTDPARSGPRDGYYTATAAAIVAEGGQAQHLYADLPIGQHDCAGIMTGRATLDIDGADMTLIDGSFADHLTSYAGNFSSSSQTKMSRWISKGASGTSGTVEEPCNYPGKFIHAEFHLIYYKGMSLGEAWLRKMAYAPFQSLLLGDPLTSPYTYFPDVHVPSPPTAPVSGVVQIDATASATEPGAQIAGLELVIDGVHARWADPGESFLFDTTWIADGWHEMRVLAFDDALTRNTGRWIGQLEVDNLGRSVTLGANPTTGDLAQAFDFSFSAAGGTVAEVRLVHNGRVVASSTSSSGVLQVFGQNLGAGPVRVQAEASFTDGTEARSAPVDLSITYSPGTPVNAPPAAFGYSKDVLAEHAFAVELPAAYDEDPAGVTYTVVTPPGQATLLSGGTGPYRVYSPDPGASGGDSLTFQVTGTGGSSSIETIALQYEFYPTIATYGCDVNPADSMVILDGLPVLGRAVDLGVDNPLGTQNAGAFAYLFFSLAPDPHYPCGTVLNGFGMSAPGAAGELLISVAPPDPGLVLIGGPWTGAGTPVEFSVPIPDDIVLAGLPAYGQALMHDMSGDPSTVKFGLTDAVEMTIGHP